MEAHLTNRLPPFRRKRLVEATVKTGLRQEEAQAAITASRQVLVVVVALVVCQWTKAQTLLQDVLLLAVLAAGVVDILQVQTPLTKAQPVDHKTALLEVEELVVQLKVLLALLVLQTFLGVVAVAGATQRRQVPVVQAELLVEAVVGAGLPMATTLVLVGPVVLV